MIIILSLWLQETSPLRLSCWECGAPAPASARDTNTNHSEETNQEERE